jgi:long-chain acyl-CoA synthetase
LREYSRTFSSEFQLVGDLTDDVLANAKVAPDRVQFSHRNSQGWQDVTCADFLRTVHGVASGLLAAGIEPGDRVALMCRTRFEWTVFDYAIWFAGAVTVPIYVTAPDDRLAWILNDSQASAVVVETSDDLGRVRRLCGPSERPQLAWAVDEGAIRELTRVGAGLPASAVERRRGDLTADSLATIVYTSGTTGSPKGCMLTHGNVMAELDGAASELDELFGGDDAATLLCLPLAHIFARIVQAGAIRHRVRLGYPGDVLGLMTDLAEFRPTFVVGVPSVFEQIFNRASQGAAADGRGRAFDKAADTAVAYSRALERGGPSLALRIKHLGYERTVYDKVRAALGGRCGFAISGGASLGDRLAHFFRGIGIPILEGYGLTETTGALTVNSPSSHKVGTVGRPLEGVAVSLSDEGELLVHGPQVFTGYWADDAATRRVMDSGWLHTGDLGEIDDEGFVTVLGRMHEVLVTAGGKRVAPIGLEERVRAHPLVGQCMAVGDGRPYVAALVTLDPDSVKSWAIERRKPTRVNDLTTDLDLHKEVQTAVDDANRSVSHAESIRKFTILPADWTEEGGHLTPSLKLRRKAISRDFRSEIDAMYP